MCCSVAKVIIILQIIPILLWDFEGGIGSSFFIYFVHDVITRILSPFKAFIPVYFLHLFMSCNSFIHRDNLALLIQRYFTPKILESGNAQLSFEFCYLSDDLMIFFFLAGNTLEHFCLNVSICVLQSRQPSSLVRRCRNTCFQKI